jgi:hypothetical protein
LKRILQKKAIVSLNEKNDNLSHSIHAYAEQKLKAQYYRLPQLGLQDHNLVDIRESIAIKADRTYY